MPGGRINRLYVRILTRLVFLCDDIQLYYDMYTRLRKLSVM
jgi:hypothetical protein